ncbi:hypothetical protein GPALN_006888 [Globodera pallida]|nr:hypothetical protein GPALN_006888 [Globodera pallida]
MIFADNKFKHQGQIAFRMPNLRPFSVGYGPNEVFSDPVEFINGFPWRIKIRRTIDDTYVGFYVDCGGESLLKLVARFFNSALFRARKLVNALDSEKVRACSTQQTIIAATVRSKEWLREGSEIDKLEAEARLELSKRRKELFGTM